MVLLELAEPVAEAGPGAEGPVTETEEPISQDAGEEGGLEPAQPLPQSESAALLRSLASETSPKPLHKMSVAT